jgi:hypothetical protein
MATVKLPTPSELAASNDPIPAYSPRFQRAPNKRMQPTARRRYT